MKPTRTSSSLPKTLQKRLTHLIEKKQQQKATIAICNYIMTMVLLKIQKTYFGDINTSQPMFRLRKREEGRERAGCFAKFVFLVSRDGCAAPPRGAMGLSAVYDCGIS